MWRYMKRSSSVISRSFIMYKPLKFFGTTGVIFFLLGLAIGIYYLIDSSFGSANGHIQILILMTILMLIGVISFLIGLLGDAISANRKILEDIQYRVRILECEQNQKKNDEFKL